MVQLAAWLLRPLCSACQAPSPILAGRLTLNLAGRVPTVFLCKPQLVSGSGRVDRANKGQQGQTMSPPYGMATCTAGQTLLFNPTCMPVFKSVECHKTPAPAGMNAHLLISALAYNTQVYRGRWGHDLDTAV